MADNEGKVEMQGEVVEAFRGGMYRIALDNDHETLGYVSGKMRRYRIRINPGHSHPSIRINPVTASPSSSRRTTSRAAASPSVNADLVRKQDSAGAESCRSDPRPAGGAHP